MINTHTKENKRKEEREMKEKKENRKMKLRVKQKVGDLIVFIVAFFGLVVVNPAFSGKSQDKLQDDIAESRKIVKEFMKTLMSELKTAISKGGYENAIDICSKKAMKITEELSRKYGVYLKRTTEKYRNPKNKPDEYELSILRKLKKMHREGKLPSEYHEKIEKEGKTLLVYVKPLVVKPFCLGCHGKNIAEGVRNKLKKIYPTDKATGYSPGDFRGIIILKKEISPDEEK